MFPQVVQRSLAGEGEVDRGVKRLCHDFLTVEPLQVGQAVEQEGGDIAGRDGRDRGAVPPVAPELSREPICCAVSVSHPLAAKPVLHVPDLHGEKLMLMRPTCSPAKTSPSPTRCGP